MANIVVVSGVGRYTDRWHPFAETSGCVARILGEAGHSVEVRTTESASCFSDLEGVDLVVVNCGGGARVHEGVHPAPAPEWDEAFTTFGSWLDAGGRCLALHTSTNAFHDWPDWVRRVGATWVQGVSGHPEISLAVFEAAPAREVVTTHDGSSSGGALVGTPNHPALGGLKRVITYDERYWRMDVALTNEVFLVHETGDRLHPVGWVSETGVLYDALGHHGRSYDSPDRVRQLVAEANWLLGR